jgi:hypothetical protein
VRLRHCPGFFAAAALSALAAAPAPAAGAETVVRPVQTYSTGAWSVAPSGAPHEVLADAVTAPTAPDTSTGYLFAHGNGPITSEVGLAAPTLAPGATITGARLYTYFGTGSGRSLAVEFRSGSTLLGLAYVPAGRPAAWRAVNASTAPSAAQLSDLRMRATIFGSGASSDVVIHAAYAGVSTDDGSTSTGDESPTDGSGDGDDSVTPPTGGDGSSTGGDATETGDTGGDDGAAGGPAAPVALAVESLKVAANGVLAIPLTCRLAAGCTGTVRTRLVRSSPAPARRRKPAKRAGRKRRFRLAPGQSKQIRVRLDRRTSRVVRRRGRAKVAVTIALDGAPAVTKQVTVRFRRGARRRR